MRHNASARRSRSRGNNGGGGNNRNRNNSPRLNSFDSNGPDVRIRGNAFQIAEKYQALARDAAGAGDKILAESYLQHAEHYQRIVNSLAGDSTATQGNGPVNRETSSGDETRDEAQPAQQQNGNNGNGGRRNPRPEGRNETEEVKAAEA